MCASGHSELHTETNRRMMNFGLIVPHGKFTFVVMASRPVVTMTSLPANQNPVAKQIRRKNMEPECRIQQQRLYCELMSSREVGWQSVDLLNFLNGVLL